MDHDEFEKEMMEAEKQLEQPKIIDHKESKIQKDDQKPKEFKNFNDSNFNEKEMAENLNKLLGMFGNLDPNAMNIDFNESDKEEYKKFHETFMSKLKDDNLFGTLNEELKNNNNDSKINSNPFTETFEEMNTKFAKDFDFGTFDKEFGKIFESLGKISEINESNFKDSSSQVKFLLENTISTLIEAKLLNDPLEEIKKEVEAYISNKELDGEKKLKYENTLKLINEALEELKQTEPNKARIVEIFSSLQESGDLDEDLFKKLTPDFSKM